MFLAQINTSPAFKTINIFKNCVYASPFLLFQKRFQLGNNINSGLVLSFDHLEKSFELDLQQPVFYSSKSYDSFVFKENDFNLSS